MGFLPSPPNPLETDLDPSAVITPLPEDIERMAQDPASVAYVIEHCRQQRLACPAIRQLRRWSMISCMLIGVILTFNVLGLAWGRAALRELVRDAVRTELSDVGLRMTPTAKISRSGGAP